MSGDVLGRRRLDVSATGTIVHLALGLLAATRRLDGVLARYARPLNAASQRTESVEGALHLVLGLIAFRRRFRATLDAAAHAARPAPAAVDDRLEVVPCR